MSKERHINELLKEQEFSKIAEIIKSKSRNTEGILYPNSPLNKAPETYLFEKIVHQVIEDFDKDSNDRKINFVKDQNQNTIIKIKEDLANSTEFLELQNKLSWNKGRSEINLKELLEKTNFNHLELDKEDIEHYAKLTNILKLERIVEVKI